MKASDIKRKFIEADKVLRNLKNLEDPLKVEEIEDGGSLEQEYIEFQIEDINITDDVLQVEIKEEASDVEFKVEQEEVKIEEDQESSEEDQDLNQEVPSGKWTCEVCSKVFQSIRGLYHHFGKYRKQDDPQHPPLHTCKRCLGRFFSTKTFDAHRCILSWRFTRNPVVTKKIPEIVEEKNDGFNCGVCPQSYDDIACLKEHCREHRSKNHAPFKTCTTCYREFYSSTLFKTHICGKLSPTCHYCCQLLPTKCEVFKHMVQEHRSSDQIFRCNFENCQHTSLSSNLMFFHLASHYEPLHLICTICAKVETNYVSFKKHNAAHRIKKTNFTCDLCGVILKNRNCTTKHMDSRHKNKRYWCDQCSLNFSTFGILKKHKMNAHGMASQFECSFCPMKFVYASEFKAHESKHIGGKRSRN